MSITHELFVIKGNLSEKYKIFDPDLLNIDVVLDFINVSLLNPVAGIFGLPSPWELTEDWIPGFSEVSDVWTRKDCLAWWNHVEVEIKYKLSMFSYWMVIIPIEDEESRREALEESVYNEKF